MPILNFSNLQLKAFLELFHDQDRFEDLEFGDTLHPECGWVDKKYFEGVYGKIDHVKDLKVIPYEFPGLFFEAIIGDANISLNGKNGFEVESKEKSKLQILIERFRDLKSSNAEYRNAEIRFSKAEVY